MYNVYLTAVEVLFILLEFNGRKSSGFREELGCYTGKSIEAAFSRYFLSSTLLDSLFSVRIQ